MSNNTTLTANAEANSSTLLSKALFRLTEAKFVLAHYNRPYESEWIVAYGLRRKVCEKLLGTEKFEYLEEVCSNTEMTIMAGARYLGILKG